jgi:effector-binding domain-containing protein
MKSAATRKSRQTAQTVWTLAALLWVTALGANQAFAGTLGEISLNELPERHCVVVQFSVVPADLSAALGEILPAAFNHVLENDALPGLVFTRTLWVAEGRMFLEAGLEVNRAVAAEGESPRGPIRAGLLPAQLAATADHYGPYQELAAGHVAVQEWWAGRGFLAVGPPVEYYVSDPTTEPDSAKWLTRIHHPVMQRQEVERQIGLLAGRWIGGDESSFMEESWSPAQGGELLGTFRMQNGGHPAFYEFQTIELAPGGEAPADSTTPSVEPPRLRIKHFGPDLVGWEEKEEAKEFRLSTVVSNQLVWRTLEDERLVTLTYSFEGRQLEIVLRKTGGERPDSESVFSLERAPG